MCMCVADNKILRIFKINDNYIILECHGGCETCHYGPIIEIKFYNEEDYNMLYSDVDDNEIVQIDFNGYSDVFQIVNPEDMIKIIENNPLEYDIMQHESLESFIKLKGFRLLKESSFKNINNDD